MSVYWDMNEAKSYNSLFNFIVGNRGSGKTYGLKKFVINDFLKNGNEFVYVRRFENGMKKAKPKFFTDILHEFEGHSFNINGDTAHINSKTAGHFIVLSKSKLFKSTPFPKVRTIIFDEFILDSGHHRYLPEEVNAFLNLYETINRTVDREIKGINHTNVWFLANAVTVTNPYFLHFGLELPRNKRKIKRVGDDVLIQLVENEGFEDIAKKSRVGKMLEGSSFYKHAFKNEFYLDNTNFIVKDPKDKQYLFTLKAVHSLYGVWRDRKTDSYFVTTKHDPSCKFVYTTILENHEPNTFLLKSSKSKGMIKFFIKAFKDGKVFYENVNTKNIIYESMKGLIR